MVILLGVVVGLAAGLPFVIYDSDGERTDPLHPLVILNVVAVGLILLMGEGPWGRAAASFTLVLAFWLALYSILTFARWRSTIETVERSKAREPQQEQSWERRQNDLPKKVPSSYRPLVRSVIEQWVVRQRKEHEQFLLEAAERNAKRRTSLLLSLGSSVLCCVGATRSLLVRTGPTP